jgi:hypothetical protein
MLYAALIAGIALLTGALSLLGFIALKLFKQSAEIARTMSDAHGRTLESLERVHDKQSKTLGEVLDRFMSLDFSQFKNYQLAEAAEEGGIDFPGEGEVAVEVPFGSRKLAVVGMDLQERLAAAANEQKLLAEDFPPGWDE